MLVSVTLLCSIHHSTVLMPSFQPHHSRSTFYWAPLSITSMILQLRMLFGSGLTLRDFNGPLYCGLSDIYPYVLHLPCLYSLYIQLFTQHICCTSKSISNISALKTDSIISPFTPDQLLFLTFAVRWPSTYSFCHLFVFHLLQQVIRSYHFCYL